MAKNLIEHIITRFIMEENCIFVFPTGASADLWADRATFISGTTAVAMERFIAWDDFKAASVKASVKDKTAAPSLMRSVFAANLIEENARKPFLREVISQKYCTKAAGFTNWIAGILPSLGQWKKIRDKKGGSLAYDDEDRDYEEIYKRYSAFLDEHALFETAWQEPQFHEDGNRYFIFYPKSLMDYAEYSEILSQNCSVYSEDKPFCDDRSVTLVHLDENELKVQPAVNVYSDSRKELTQTAIKMRSLHETQNVPWTQMALSVSDLETYSPYIEREFSIREIPFSIREGHPLSKTGAGSFFAQIRDCYDTNFSFDSIKHLLLNNQLPWINPAANTELIEFGKNNNCLCSFEYNGKKHDVWEDAFRKFNPKKEAPTELIKNLYGMLKEKLVPLANAKTFAQVKKAYFAFKEKFFDAQKFTVQADSIISRCISELEALVKLEEQFPDCTVPCAFNFFNDYLETVRYIPQGNSNGVTVYPYRPASTAPYEYHFVIDASQTSMSLGAIFKRMSFLSETKRAALNIEDIDPTNYYMTLYRISSGKECVFSVAEKTFTGYAFAHGFLKESKAELFEDTHTYKNIADGFAKWNKCVNKISEDSKAANLSELIRNKLFDEKSGRYRISQSAMSTFFTCPRLWLFKYILNTAPLNNETELVDDFTDGIINHNALEIYCNKLKELSLPVKTEENGLAPEYEKLLSESVDEALDKYETSNIARDLIKIKRKKYYDALKTAVIEFSRWFCDYEIAETEQQYWFAPEGKNYILNGRVDCVLKNTQTGEYTLVDYKTSSNSVPGAESLLHDPETSETLPDFQMPMYIELMENQDKKKRKQIENSVFFTIKDPVPTVVKGSVTNAFTNKTKECDKDFEPTMEVYRQCLDEYMERILAEDFEIDEKIQNYPVCTDKNCRKYRAICRRFFTVSGR